MKTSCVPCLLTPVLIALCILCAAGCSKQIQQSRTVPSRSTPGSTVPSQPGPRQDNRTGTQKTYTVMGQTYSPVASADKYTESGIASWYGKKFHGRLTASGEMYDMHGFTAAHRILPMQTRVEVTNLDNGRHTIVRINDRGPFVNNRIIDLSYGAAKQLGLVGPGTARVRIKAFETTKKALHGPFYVQVGSFTLEENARRLQAQLQQQGYSQTRTHPIALNGKTFWQVHAGIFQTLTRAETARQHLRRENPACFILAD